MTGDPYVRIEWLTPEKASKWLKHNTHNRDLNPGRVKVLAGAIERGEWKLSPDAFAFSGNGERGVLLNGQHRAHAVVQAQIGVPVLVLYNVAPGHQEVMDSGLSRSLGAKLKLRGEKYFNDLAASLFVAWSVDNYGEPRAGFIPTHQQLLDYLDANPDIRDGLVLGNQLRKTFSSLPGNWSGWVFLARRSMGASVADDFFERLISGADLDEDSPVLHMRRLLLKQQRMNPERRLGPKLVAASLVKCVNRHALGQPAGLLKVDVRESFPSFVTKEELAL